MRRIATALKRPIFNLIDRVTFTENQFSRFFAEAANWTVEQLRDYQLKKLREISKVWDLGIETWDDFYALPLTSKEDIAHCRPPEGVKYHRHESSGSTGEPRIVHVPWETWYRKDALFHRSWDRLGREPHQPVLRLIAGEPQYAWYDWWRNDKIFNRQITEECVDWTIKNEPCLIHGPGNGIRILCEEIIKRGRIDVLANTRIVWCSTSSEGHRERLEPFVRGFHEQYGLAELPTVGSPCLYNTHVVMETGVVEVIHGEIVVTDFNNYLLPIIRYRTGDEGKIRESDCRCERHHPILYDIKGRRTDYYDGPEVKRPVGWWVVSPISHDYGDAISNWKAEVFPKDNRFVLRVVLRSGSSVGELEPYKQWIEDEIGLDCEIISESRAVKWKRELVKVVINE